MRFRWTMKELEKVSDEKVLETLITERQSTCINIYSPLYRRLNKIKNRLEGKEELTFKGIGR